MSEKDLFESIIEPKKETPKVEKTEKAPKLLAKDERGNPANEHAKAIAKEKSAKKEKQCVTLYTNKDGKILRIDVKPNGAYSSYIGNYKKNKEIMNGLIIQWEKDGVYFPEHQLEKKIKEILASF